MRGAAEMNLPLGHNFHSLRVALCFYTKQDRCVSERRNLCLADVPVTLLSHLTSPRLLADLPCLPPRLRVRVRSLFDVPAAGKI